MLQARVPAGAFELFAQVRAGCDFGESVAVVGKITGCLVLAAAVRVTLCDRLLFGHCCRLPIDVAAAGMESSPAKNTATLKAAQKESNGTEISDTINPSDSKSDCY